MSRSPSLRLALAVAPFALAAVAGAAWGLTFGRHGLLVAPWLALAPLLLLLTVRRRAITNGWIGLVHGLGCWLTAIPWIAPTLETFGQLAPVLAWAGLILLAGYLALFHAAFAALAGPLWQRAVEAARAGERGRGWLALAGVPGLWVAFEWLRAHLFTGFPWNLAAYSFVAVPGALPLTAWIGSYGLSALVVAVNAALALAIATRRPVLPAMVLLGCLVALAAGGRWGRGEAVEGAPRAVRILQPNIPNLVTYDERAVQRNYQRVFRLAAAACDEPGALLVWPESAAWPYSYTENPGFRRDLERLLAAGCPLLVNSPSRQASDGGEARWFNSGILLAPGVPAARYDKQHLVPYGEYVPFSGLLSFYDSMARNAGDFTAAEELHLLPWGDEKVGLSICFEITFPGEVAARAAAGATLLATVTNDAWYGDTAAPYQHFRAARFRAAENRRPLLRAAITGISGLIAPDGTVLETLGVGEEGYLAARVRPRRDLSPYSRIPWLVPVLATAVAAAALVAGRRDHAARGNRR